MSSSLEEKETDSKNIPVIIEAGQVTKRETSPVHGGSPIDLMAEAVKVAVEDSGLAKEYLKRFICLSSPRFFPMNLHLYLT